MKNGKEKQDFICSLINKYIVKETMVEKSFYILQEFFYERGVVRENGKLKEIKIPLQITLSSYRVIVRKLISENRIYFRTDFVKETFCKKKLFLIKQK